MTGEEGSVKVGPRKSQVEIRATWKSVGIDNPEKHV